jgi:hypothetical protein
MFVSNRDERIGDKTILCSDNFVLYIGHLALLGVLNKGGYIGLKL